MQKLWRNRNAEVWTGTLDLVPGELKDLQSVLTSQEWRTADQYVHAKLKVHFIARRARTRIVLADHTGLPLEQLQFHYDAKGKPSLGPGLPHFSISTSEDHIVVAISPTKAVGIDLEAINLKFDYDPVLGESFKPDERAAIMLLPPSERVEAFYRGWVRKEACAKALGLGFHCDFTSLPVSHLPEEGPWEIQHPATGLRLTGHDLTVAPNFKCAVAITSVDTTGESTAPST